MAVSGAQSTQLFYTLGEYIVKGFDEYRHLDRHKTYRYELDQHFLLVVMVISCGPREGGLSTGNSVSHVTVISQSVVQAGY